MAICPTALWAIDAPHSPPRLPPSRSAFAQFETVPFNPDNSLGDVKFAIDPWNGTLLHYRVQVTELASGDGSLDPPAIIDASPPTRAIDQENTVFVSPSLGQDSASCGVLQNGPCKTMQAAIDVAKLAGATVAATPGEYSGPGNVDLDVGGAMLRITSTNGPTHTLINCTDPSGAQHRAFLFRSGEDERTELSGFTLFGGEADRGGCVYVENSSPTISNVAMVMCKAMSGISRGGALYVTGPAANPTVTGSMFFYNQADKGGTIDVMESSMQLDNSKLELGVCPTGTGEGGGIHALRSNITVRESSFVNGIAGFAGAGILLHDSVALLERIEVVNNTVANTGAGINLYGSSMTLVDSLVTDNTSNLFGGGLLFTSSNATILRTAVTNNYAGFGGGAVKLLGGYLNLTSCQISGNVGVEYGAAFDVMTQGPLSVQQTVMVVDRCEISDNVAGDGAAFYLYDIDEVAVSNSIVRNNSARAGGAVWSRAPRTTSFSNVFFHDNFAVDGGAIYCTEPCEMDIASTEFARNGASNMGGAIFSTEGTRIEVIGSSFVENGAQSCDHRQTPLRGGAVSVGVEVLDAFSDSCAPINGTKTTVLSISDALFSSNLAQMAGGAIFAESGEVNVQRTAFEDNRAGVPHVRDGLGGALSLRERCVNGTCTMLHALVHDSEIHGNVAQLAGGGIYVSGSNPKSQTTIANAKFVANQASSGFSMGIGGGLYFENPRLNVTYAQFSNNTAKMLGGAVYVSSDGGEGVTLDNLFMADNHADNGRDVFWEKLKFANDEYLPSNSIIFAIDDDAEEGDERGVIATESIEVLFAGEVVPDVTQSGTTLAPISLNIIDFYGQLAITEEGECRASVSDNSASVRALGSVVAIRSGRAVFSELQITGKIGSTIHLDITCTTNVEYLSGLLSPRTLPVVGFDIALSRCTAGSSPVSTGEGDVCVACRYGTFSDDGKECSSCPRGAMCPGGSGLLSEANWWRSSATSLDFYQCLYPDVCLPGDHAGNDACADGHEGPLCGVCKDGWFEFAGKCRECNGRNATSKIFIAFSAVIIVAVLALLFARSWDFGDPTQPGMLSKVKIVLVHFQIISLLKRYDVKWPPASEEGFSWLSVIDFGPGMLAPECWIGKKYTFWTSWILNVAALPVLVLVLCSGIHRIAVVAHRARMRRYPEGSKLGTWLVGLQLRCYKNAYWLLTLVYPGACLVALQMFARERLDIGTFLSSDLSLKVRV
jgi:predicted outer membrane repeat protein